jgi:hypothetical protein
MSTFEQIYMVSEEIDFEILRSDLLLRLCDDWCCHQNFSLIFDFTRLRLGLQIDIFGIIAQGSDFPEMTLQNCKSDTTTPLSNAQAMHTQCTINAHAMHNQCTSNAQAMHKQCTSNAQAMHKLCTSYAQAMHNFPKNWLFSNFN